ncbi:MAG: HAMP domain-containing histidine kinase [Anaerolineae bacterium]|jgi:signal transduction histidine kinase|nr:HAMP domain-containing histidine kinase [Anaerolineae bacterium]MBT3714001.1 HAMP domain-containing histidine kinase [Anaerolineae bacterium]MBT4308805.1 HAMP domain-containing histidine kinase [Anaerolineae bacterium]MBT4459696.1 HAMP domain-containing histidine kinase [Anaerolineae bacterium]MBT6063035.1 HAMP domain-containing histidine kinase [Anaerolineae bacterium]
MRKIFNTPLKVSFAITPLTLGISLLLEWLLTGLITSTTIFIAVPLTFIMAYVVTSMMFRYQTLLDKKNRELQKVTNELREINTDITKHNTELDAFAQTIAHELKTPLGVIVGYSHLLGKDDIYTNHDRVQQVGKEITQTSLKMNTIIQEMLLMAKLRQIDDVEIHPLDMEKILAESLENLSSLIFEAQAEIIAPETWLPVRGYAPWVEKVWNNFISNALKYGGENPKIELGAQNEANGQVRFWVKDYGRGMTARQQEQAFRQFTRFDPSKIQGHGLGLSITQRIVEKLGGEVGVESEIKVGSTFYFTLPSTN